MADDSSGKSRNYDIGAANEAFKNLTGRDLNQAEKTWLNSRGDVSKTGHDVAATALAQGYSALSQNILSDAQNVYGLKNFSIEDANKLRDSLYIAGDQRSHDTFFDRAGAALANRKTEDLINPQVKTEDTSKYNTTVTGLFQEYLGRDPKAYELEHFSKQLAQGDSPYLLASALQQAPEYMDKQAEIQRGKMATELQGFQQQAFEKAQPSIISSFMRAGRLNSSGLNSALAKAQQELEQQRQQYLAGITREDLVNNRARAFDIFSQQALPAQQRAAALTQQQWALPFQAGAQLTARGNELSDYYRQQNDFNRYLQMQKDAQSSASRYGLYGQILGAGLQGSATYYGLKGK